jgi:epoxyqueuosine reductase QueG
MSATEMRGYIKSGEYDTFMGKMRETGIPDEKSAELYEKVIFGMSRPPPLKKKPTKKGGKTNKRRKQRRTRRRRTLRKLHRKNV